MNHKVTITYYGDAQETAVFSTRKRAVRYVAWLREFWTTAMERGHVTVEHTGETREAVGEMRERPPAVYTLSERGSHGDKRLASSVRREPARSLEGTE